MYDKENLINQIMEDWSYMVHDGVPNVKNYEHRDVLRIVMEKHDIPTEAINLIIQNLIYGKLLLQETDSLSSITTTALLGRNKTHMTGSGHQTYIDPYMVQNHLPVQDTEEDEEELEDANQETTIETYIFDRDQMKIVETGDTVSLDDVLSENKFKCFMTGEVYCETKNGKLVKENDLVKNKNSENKQ